MRSGIKIRRLVTKDADAIARLSDSTPQAGKWEASNYSRLTELGMEGWVALVNEQIVGFLIVRCAASELEILNVAIAQEFRRTGIATALLAHCLKESSQQGARKVFLEVRESNHPAISLYQRIGFHISGRRNQYYQDPSSENAVLMARDLLSQD